MKYIIGLISIVLLIWLFLFQKHNASTNTPFNSMSLASPSTTPSLLSQETITYRGKTYAYQYFTVTNSDELLLIPNFTEKLSSVEITQANACLYGINAGFYDTKNNPLGGFKTNNTVLKKPIQNRLIDGFIWKDSKLMHISLSHPSDDAIFYLQTGPLLALNGGLTQISINNDEYKRRSVAGITKEGSIVFMILYNPESIYEGPLLADLPAIIQQIDTTSSWELTNAINLDGGSASAYITKDIQIQEFSPVGSFFCIK